MSADDKYRSVLAGMFTDPRFRQLKKFRRYGEVDGAKIGVVIANKSANYPGYALNVADVEALLAAKRGGKVDPAFIAAFNNGTLVAHHDAEKFHDDVLVHKQTRSGQFGEFWTLTHDEITGEPEPF